MSEIIVRFPDFPDMPALSNQATGDGYWLVDVPGWWSGVDSRNEDDPRPDGDGDYDQDPVYGGPRFPIVIGRVQFADEAALFAARDPLARIMAHRAPFTLEVESLDGVQQATVVRNGRLGWDMTSAPFRVEFEMPFKAADPRKYGPVQSGSTGLPVSGGGVESPVVSPFTQIGGGSPGRVAATNQGSTDTLVTMKVTGGMSQGVQLTRIETGERLRLEWPILDTDVVRFSPGDGQVWLNEQSPISGYLTYGEWWTLGPGETATVQFEGLGTVTGSPSLTVEWRDADA